jgi:putative transposase
MCSLFGISRSGYYSWLNVKDQPDKDAPLLALIAQCHTQTDQTYGYRRVKIWLQRKHCLRINHKAILRVMRKAGISSVVRRHRKYKQCRQELHKYPNLLNRNFKADRANEKWVTDITYIHTRQGVLYLSAIKDLYDGFIVSYKTASAQTIHLVTETIRNGLNKEKIADGLALHSDQGFQYTSRAYYHLTKDYGMTPSMSRRGNCYDNASMENFFGILKTECIHRSKIDSFKEANQLIARYVNFYNYERIQLKTKLTPFEKRCQSA